MQKTFTKRFLTGFVFLLALVCFGRAAKGQAPEWTFLNGHGRLPVYATYGTQGVADARNTPGARYESVIWEAGGKLYLFGGRDALASSSSSLNDLWEFDPVSNNWRWLKGQSGIGAQGIYGTQLVEDAANTPGARNGSVSWVANGKLYLFGGHGNGAAGGGNLNDLWEYNPATNNWRWLKGSTFPGEAGRYGTQNVADDNNAPGGRTGAGGWENDGKLYLYGGSGYAAITYNGSLNDLWEFDLATNKWRWLKGSNALNERGTYGTQGSYDNANKPGARSNFSTWKSGNKFYLFGGGGNGQTTAGDLNDLWEYDPDTNNWRWVKGPANPGSAGEYGIQGTFDVNNMPPARKGSFSWAHAGKLYLFGGRSDYSSVKSFNDLWEFDPATTNWRWIKGSNNSAQPGEYGSLQTEHADNTPGARQYGSACSIEGSLYLFGGMTQTSTASGAINDLWKFNVTTNNWSWLKGSNYLRPTATYGTRELAEPANNPGPRTGAVKWTHNGKFFLFGGNMVSGMDFSPPLLNDLWEYDPQTGNWRWLHGSSSVNQPGTYGTQGTATSATVPGAREGAVSWESNGKLYLFGGEGYGTSVSGTLNDLWEYNPATNQWRWLKGNSHVSSAGIYGVQGTAGAANYPGSRSRSAGWATGGKLYLFGGLGNAEGSRGTLNDLWEYDPATNNWRWLSGTKVVNATGVYGTQGVANASNRPGARTMPFTWATEDKLYLFGGEGYSNWNQGTMGDLWEFDLSTKNWRWIKGSNLPDQKGVYGQSGVPAESNLPGSVRAGQGWTSRGKFYLFGGTGRDITGNLGTFNHLWEYDPLSNIWLWMSGSSLINQPGYYETEGVAASDNIPGGRHSVVGWESNRHLYLFGGVGYGVNGDVRTLSDLWKVNVTSSNAYLSDMTASEGTLSPAFSPEVTAYSLAVTVSSIEIIPVFDPLATVTINGSSHTSGTAKTLGLDVGANTFTIVVTAEDGQTQKTYTLTVNRSISANADLAGLTINPGTLSPGFATATQAYTASVTEATIDIVPASAHANATITVNGEAHTSGTPESIGLNHGPNVISIGVTAEDGTTQKTYSVTVDRKMTPPGNALAFGNNEKIMLNAAGSLATDFGGTSSFTIEAWVNPSAFAGNSTIFTHKNSGFAAEGYSLFFLSDGILYLEGTNSDARSTVAAKPNRWWHVAVTFTRGTGTSGTATFYLNGEVAGSGPIDIKKSWSPAFIGNFEVYEQPFKGSIDELKIWNTVLTQAQIKSGMTSIVDPASPGLLAYYNFDQGIAGAGNSGITTLDDKTANNYDGAMTGFALSGSSSNWVESYALVVPVTTAATDVTTTGFTANWTGGALGTIDRYSFDVATDVNFTSILPGYNGKDAGTAASANVTGLAPGKTYYYRVAGEKASMPGQGSYSNVMNVITAPVAGRGRALALEGSRSEGVSVNNEASLNFGTNSFTIEAWIKRTQDAGHATIIGKQNSATSTGYYLRVTDNKLSFAAGTYPNSTEVNGTKTIDDNNWHHVAAVMDVAARSMSLYVDGVLDASQSFGVNYSGDSDVPLGIGFKPQFGEYFTGSLDEVRIWGTARTVDQINEYMNTPLAGTESGLAGYWNFEDPHANLSDDLSVNNNTGSPQNFDGDELHEGNIPFAVSVKEDMPIVLRLGGSNLTDQSAATAIITSFPSNGTLYHTDNGTTRGSGILPGDNALKDAGGNPRRLIYVPGGNYTGPDSFTYSVQSGSSVASNTETVTLTVGAVNDAPRLSSPGTMLYASEGIAVNVLPANFLVSDADNTTLSSGVISITANFQTGEDVLQFTNNGSTMGNITGSFDATSGVLTLVSAGAEATVSEWQDAFRSVTYINTSDVPVTSNRTINFSVSDGDLQSPAVSRIIRVLPVNDPPVLSATPADPTFTEEGAAVSVFSDASVDPIEPGNRLRQLRLTVKTLKDMSYERIIVEGRDIFLVNGYGTTITSLGLSAGVSIASNIATVTLTKATGITASEMEGVINGIRYRNLSPNPTAADRVITLEYIEDTGGGTAAGTTLTVASTVTVVAVNDAPVLTVPASAVVTPMNTNVLFSVARRISVSDGDAGLNPVQVSLTASNGSVTLPRVFGLTFSAGDGTADVTMTFSGTVTNINSALNGLSFIPETSFAGSASLDVTVDDLGNTGTGGALTNLKNVPITVTSSPPAVTSVSSTVPDGTYKIGKVVGITTQFDQPVMVTGTPQILLKTGTADRLVNYSSGSGTSTLTFDYTVEAGDQTGDLDYSGSSALTLNDGSIKNAYGDDAVLTLSAPGAANSLGYNKAIVIDGVRPTASILVTEAMLKENENSLVTFSFSEAVAGFTNDDLTIGNGSLTSVSTSDNITWTAVFTPAMGVLSASNQISLDLAGITDVAGNAGAGTESSNSYAIDTKIPALIITVDKPALKISETAVITFTFSEDPELTFALGDIVVTGGTLSAFSGSGLSYNAIFSPDPAANNGTANISVARGAYTNAAGRQGGEAVAPAIIYDTQAPPAPSVPDLADASDSGSSDSDHLTNVTTPVISGTAEAGSTVTLYGADGTTVLGTAAAAGDGKWSIISAALGAGVHSLTAKATDAAGNISVSSSSLSLVIDLTPPLAAIVVTPADGATIITGKPVISGTAEPASAITIEIDGSAVSSSVVVDGSGNWTYTPGSDLSNGSHTITARVMDLAGNAGAVSSTTTVTVSAHPAIYASGVLTSLTSIYGTASAAASFTVSADNLTEGILVTPPAGFEVSADNSSFAGTVTIGAAGIMSATPVYVRLKNGINAGNYSGNMTLTSAGATPVNLATHVTNTVNRALLTITATGLDKEYDGGNNATVTLSDDRVSGDVLTLAYSGATFSDKHAGAGKPVSVTGITITGADAGNYTFNTGAGTSANITSKALNVTAAATNKVYDGNTTAAVTLSDDRVSGDVLTLVYTTAVFGDKNTGLAKPVTVSGIAVSGTDAANYSFNTTAITSADITAKALSVSAAGINKEYDGNTTATVTLSDDRVSGDVLSLDYTAAAFDNKNAGTVKSVSVSGIAVAGTDAGNYTFNTTANATADITAKTLTITASGINKVYDGNSAATVTLSDDRVSGDVLTAAYAGASFGDKNVGTGKAVTVSGITISGTDASNYTFNTAASTTGDITSRAVTVAAQAQSKVYGEADPALTYTVSPALETGDTFTGALGRAAGENVGSYAIDLNTLALSPNYDLVFAPAALTITKAPLTITAGNKQKFVGTANPELTVTYSGFVNGEQSSVLSQQPSVTTTATTASPLGDYPITATGAAAANYEITYVNGTLKVVPGAPTSVALASVTLHENRPAGTAAGTLSSTSEDPNAVFTYELVTGSGDTDNSLFTIAGNKLQTAALLNFEQKNSYSVRVRSTTQHGFSLDQVFTVALSDVNETPTLAAIADETICHTTAPMTVQMSGATAGPETSQTISYAVSSDNDDLLDELSINASGQLTYQVKNGRSGTVNVTVTVTDNGGTANGGVDTFSRTFVITVNPLPVITIASDKGNSISKGDVVRLTATGGATYSWTNPGGIVSGLQSATVTFRPEKTATYRVTVTTAAGCVENREITIEVKEDYVMLNQTNIVTPNGDGVNDNFVIKNIDMYPNNVVKIYDRAGRLLYSKTNYANEWNGTVEGSPLAEGTYYYIVDFGTNRPVLKGFITIVKD